MSDRFEALVLDQAEGKTINRIEELSIDDLPEGDVLVDVTYSTLNYKDGLAITGAGKIVRSFPFVPGIDFAGRVAQSSNANFHEGDEVLLTGWGVGERHWGGLAKKARVKGDWLVKLPSTLSLKHAMSIGTAGFTAMLAVMALEEQSVTPEKGEVLVTGASGGVGSMAIPLLAKRNFQVVASTGRPELEPYLKGLGASSILDRKELSQPSKAPLESARWSGAIDTVGGETLVSCLKAMRYHGVVASCGLAGSAAFNGTVYPFVLRGVRLIGIDSVNCPMPQRVTVWDNLAEGLTVGQLDAMTTQTISLREVASVAPKFLAGAVQGRIVVDMSL